MQTSSARLQTMSEPSEPDGHELSDECESYETFTTAKAVMMIGKPPIAVAPHEWGITNGTAAWVLSLDR
jgi:hypothetical protein